MPIFGLFPSEVIMQKKKSTRLELFSREGELFKTGRCLRSDVSAC